MKENSLKKNSLYLFTAIILIISIGCSAPSLQTSNDISETIKHTSPQNQSQKVVKTAETAASKQELTEKSNESEATPGSPHSKTGFDNSESDTENKTNETMDAAMFEELRKLAIIWNHSKGRGKNGAHAATLLKQKGNKYYSLLLRSLEHPNSSYRSMAALTLAFSGKIGTQDKIIEAFKSEKEKAVRGDYLLTLSLIADSSFPLEIIQTVIDDKDPLYASHATHLLFFVLERDTDFTFAEKFSKINGGELVIEQLSREDEKGYARKNALLVLGKYPTRKAIGKIINLMASNKKNKALISLASNALKNITGQEFTDTRQWQSWNEENALFLKWNPELKIFEIDEESKQSSKPVEASQNEYK